MQWYRVCVFKTLKSDTMPQFWAFKQKRFLGLHVEESKLKYVLRTLILYEQRLLLNMCKHHLLQIVLGLYIIMLVLLLLYFPPLFLQTSPTKLYNVERDKDRFHLNTNYKSTCQSLLSAIWVSNPNALGRICSWFRDGRLFCRMSIHPTFFRKK